MDLPIFLEKQDFVKGKEFIEQQFTLILHSEYGDFLSSWNLGSAVSPHVTDLISLDLRLRTSLSAIEGIKIKDIEFKGDTIKIKYAYAEGIVEFLYENT